MTTATDLYAEVCRAPDCLAARGIWRDALCESGLESERVRGEFVSVQMELAVLEPRLIREYNSIQGMDAAEGMRNITLRRRERELLDRHGLFWRAIATGVTLLPESCTFRNGAIERVACPLDQFIGVRCFPCGGTGFVGNRSGWPVDRNWCDACKNRGRVNAIGPVIIAACPLREFKAADKEPIIPSFDEMACWHADDRGSHSGTIPICLYAKLRGEKHGDRCRYRTRQAALADLSQAAIALCR